MNSMPDGWPVPPIFLATELVAYAWTILCVRHAWRNGRWTMVVAFLAASLYGFALEYGEVRANVQYCYGNFLLMVPWWRITVPHGYACADGMVVPLWIILAWGCTFYAATTTAQRLDVPWLLRPVIAAVVAVTLDFIVDPFAGFIGYWKWYVDGPYFGIPLDNYFGWLLTVSLYVLVLSAMQRRWPPGTSRFGAFGAPFVAAVPAALGVALGMKLYAVLAIVVPEWVIVGGAYVIAIGAIVPWRLRVGETLPVDWVILGMPLFYLWWYVALIGYVGLYLDRPALLVPTLLVAVGVVLGYGWPYKLTVRPGSARTGA